MTERSAYIGLGSNLVNPIDQLIDALQALNAINNTKVLLCSSFYASKPMGPQDQPDYVNAVVHLSTELAPLSLLDALQSIETQQGRVRNDRRWGARTLDLDLLLYDQESIDLPRLTVPHYGLREREFVLYPLAEIAPDLVLPGGDNLKSILNKCAMNGLSKIPMDEEMCKFLTKFGKS